MSLRMLQTSHDAKKKSKRNTYDTIMSGAVQLITHPRIFIVQWKRRIAHCISSPAGAASQSRRAGTRQGASACSRRPGLPLLLPAFSLSPPNCPPGLNEIVGRDHTNAQHTQARVLFQDPLIAGDEQVSPILSVSHEVVHIHLIRFFEYPPGATCLRLQTSNDTRLKHLIRGERRGRGRRIGEWRAIYLPDSR